MLGFSLGFANPVLPNDWPDPEHVELWIMETMRGRLKEPDAATYKFGVIKRKECRARAGLGKAKPAWVLNFSVIEPPHIRPGRQAKSYAAQRFDGGSWALKDGWSTEHPICRALP